jgi:hypothetical protein
MASLSKRELELQQLRISGRKAKRRRLSRIEGADGKAIPLDELRNLMKAAGELEYNGIKSKPVKGKRRAKKRRSKKSVHPARNAEGT